VNQDLPTPVSLIKGALHVVPAPALRPGLRLVMRAMRRQHPALFRRLARLAPATILFEPDDTPHCFLLTIAEDDLRLTLVDRDQAASARIKGSLANLLYLMEGRIDSDTLFFSRAVTIGGDTAVAVGFRNTLDGELISLLADALAAAGPLAAPGRRLAERVDRGVARIRSQVIRLRDAVHRAAHGGRDMAEENKVLAAEVADLRARIAKLEATSRRRREHVA
jgi:predicted lipid carrier protein YhbT